MAGYYIHAFVYYIYMYATMYNQEGMQLEEWHAIIKQYELLMNLFYFINTKFYE